MEDQNAPDRNAPDQNAPDRNAPDRNAPDRSGAMAAALEKRLSEAVWLPDNSALREPARMAYRAGWAQAILVSENAPGTHPADRRTRIPDRRMETVLARIPKTGTGWLSGTLYRTENTVRRYAAQGYRDSAERAATLGLQGYLESHPEQAEARELERRLECLEQMRLWGSADIFTARGMGHIPRTMDGRSWMEEQVRILLEERAGPNGAGASPT